MNKNWIAVIFLILVSMIVHGTALNNPYYFDDEVVIQDNKSIETASPPFHFYKNFGMNQLNGFSGNRPTLMMSYWANIKLFGKSPASIRAGNILIHTLNALLVVFIILQLIKISEVWSFAWWCGFAFLLHPIQTLGINFLWKRSSLLEVCFILLAIFFHVRERNRDKPYRYWMIALQIFFLMGAATTKESGIVLSVIILFIDLIFYLPKLKYNFREVLPIYIPLTLVSAIFYFLIIFGSASRGSPIAFLAQTDSRALAPLSYFLKSLTVLPRYFLLWLFPKPLLFDDPRGFESDSFLWMTGGIGLFVLSIYVSIRCRKNPKIPFFIGLIWIVLAPTIVSPIKYVMDQIRLYLPLMGMNGLMATALFSLKKQEKFQRIIPYVLALLLIAYAGATFLQNIRYRHPHMIFQDVVEQYPNSGVGWDRLAIAYERVNLYDKSFQAHQNAARVEPENPDFLLKEKMWEAFVIRDPILRRKKLEALDVSNVTVSILLSLIWSEIEIKEYQAATLHLSEAQKRFPAYPPVHLTLGILWEKTGDIENARKAYANTLLMEPDNAEALEGQGRIGKPKY